MSPVRTLLGTFLAMHLVVIASAAAGLLTAMLAALLPAGLLTTLLAALLTAGLLAALLAAGLLATLLTAAAFARPLALLVGLIPLLALGLVSGLLRSFRLLRVVRHIDSPRMLKADVEAACTVEPAATGRM
jgi:hypothetical protein